MTIRINKRQAIRLLEKAVIRKGHDYVFTDRCVYFNGINSERCMVGEAFSIAGVSDKDLVDMFGSVGLLTSSSRDKSIKDIVYLTAGAREVLQVAQSQQDARQTWGTALSKAKLV